MQVSTPHTAPPHTDTATGPEGAARTAAALAEVVARFAERHVHLSDPYEAHDRCIEASEAFVAACEQAGLPAETVTGARFGEVPEFPGVRLLLNAHTATLLPESNVVYDWTARQFDSAADWPTVQPLSTWREKWVSRDHW